MRFFTYNNGSTYIIEVKGSSIEVSLEELIQLIELLSSERNKILKTRIDSMSYQDVDNLNLSNLDSDWIWGPIDDDDESEEL